MRRWNQAEKTVVNYYYTVEIVSLLSSWNDDLGWTTKLFELQSSVELIIYAVLWWDKETLSFYQAFRF